MTTKKKQPWVGQVDLSNGEIRVVLDATEKQVRLEVSEKEESKLTVSFAQGLVSRLPKELMHENMQHLAMIVATIFGGMRAPSPSSIMTPDLLLEAIDRYIDGSLAQMPDRDPASVAASFIETIGIESVRELVYGVAFERVVDAVVARAKTRAPEGDVSLIPAHVAKVWDELEKAVAAQAAS